MGAPGHLVQILVPVADNAGRRFPDRIWEELKSDLANRFGGVTAYRRAPAEGVWKNRREGRTDDEDLFVVEVMTDTLDETYWEKLQEDLEQQLDQERIVIRATQFVGINRQRLA
jgi:hypothetical protein